MKKYIFLIQHNCFHMIGNASFILKGANRNTFPFCHFWQQEDSTRSSSSVAASNSRVHREKNMIRRMSGQWIWEAKFHWHIKDLRMGDFDQWQLQVECVFLFFFLSSSQCVRDGCGSDASLYSLRIRGLASFQHELLRPEKNWYRC